MHKELFPSDSNSIQKIKALACACSSNNPAVVWQQSNNGTTAIPPICKPYRSSACKHGRRVNGRVLARGVLIKVKGDW